MNVRPSILCPIDFSEASAGALRYAAAIAEHFAARLIVLTVEDPLLTEAVDLGTGIIWNPDDCKREMAQFAREDVRRRGANPGVLDTSVAVGRPAGEILRVARQRSCELIVMSTHGLTGIRKLFFGSTTERVTAGDDNPRARDAALDPGPVHVEDAARLIRRILVPVDLSPASLYQTQVARGLAEALAVPLILVHVVEPLRSPAGGEAARRRGRSRSPGGGRRRPRTSCWRPFRCGSIRKRSSPTEIPPRSWQRCREIARPAWS